MFRKSTIRIPGFLLASLLLTVWVFHSYRAAAQDDQPLKIGFSKASENYINWLKRVDSTLIVVDFYAMRADSAASLLGDCDALVLTGGEDIFPGRYGKTADTSVCEEIDRRRDTLEFALVEKAMARKIPIFGICRGFQLLNVYLGGTLYADIPSQYGTKTAHRCNDYRTCNHLVRVQKPSVFAMMTRCDTATVTTNHHQGVEKLAPGLRACALSADNLIESFEWSQPDRKSFMLSVQWHPERMAASNPLSGRLAEEFLKMAVFYTMYGKNEKP